MNTTSLHYTRISHQHKSKRRIGITRGQAIIFILAFYLFFYLLTELVFASGETTPVPFKEVTVQQGDSVWKLASRNHAAVGLDVQELVDVIIEVNELESVIIHPGQNLKIPLPS